MLLLLNIHDPAALGNLYRFSGGLTESHHGDGLLGAGQVPVLQNNATE
jgi:hypothetical protein